MFMVNAFVVSTKFQLRIKKIKRAAHKGITRQVQRRIRRAYPEKKESGTFAGECLGALKRHRDTPERVILGSIRLFGMACSIKYALTWTCRGAYGVAYFAVLCWVLGAKA